MTQFIQSLDHNSWYIDLQCSSFIQGKEPFHKGEHQGNLAEIVTERKTSYELVMGAWCGFTAEFAKTMMIPDTTLGT